MSALRSRRGSAADNSTAGLIALDNSIFDLMTLLGVIDERPGTVASHCSYAAALWRAGSGVIVNHHSRGRVNCGLPLMLPGSVQAVS
jgi:hypothetical protein